MKDRIKSLRKEKSLTQKELALRLNLDQTTVSKWELGKAIPDTPMLVQLSNFFDVSTDYLLGISSLYYPDRLKFDENNKLLNFEPDVQELIDLYQALEPQYKEQILEYVRYISERRGIKRKKAD